MCLLLRSARPLTHVVSLCYLAVPLAFCIFFLASDNITTLVSAYRDMRPEMEEAAVSRMQRQAAADSSAISVAMQGEATGSGRAFATQSGFAF